MSLKDEVAEWIAKGKELEEKVGRSDSSDTKEEPKSSAPDSDKAMIASALRKSFGNA